jgi:hypothetical protein
MISSEAIRWRSAGSPGASWSLDSAKAINSLNRAIADILALHAAGKMSTVTPQ